MSTEFTPEKLDSMQQALEQNMVEMLNGLTNPRADANGMGLLLWTHLQTIPEKQIFNEYGSRLNGYKTEIIKRHGEAAGEYYDEVIEGALNKLPFGGHSGSSAHYTFNQVLLTVQAYREKFGAEYPIGKTWQVTRDENGFKLF